MSVSVGSEPNVNTNVLLEILGSSASVAARVADYQKAKQEAEVAFDALRIGKDAHAAYADAQAKTEAAQAALEQAQSNADAAISTLGDANARAVEIVKGAESQRDRILAELAGAKAALDARVASAEEGLRVRQGELDRQAAEIGQIKAEAAAAMGEADRIKADALDAKAKADKAEADFRSKAAGLTETLAKLTGGK